MYKEWSWFVLGGFVIGILITITLMNIAVCSYVGYSATLAGSCYRDIDKNTRYTISQWELLTKLGVEADAK